MVQSIPMGLEPLAARGIVFARVRGDASAFVPIGCAQPDVPALRLVTS